MDNKEFINRIVERSLISIGNNYRIKTAMEKVRSGEKVTIVYFGASITSGFAIEKQECFAVKSYNYFLKKFGTGNNIIYINTGIPGTSSLFGLLRMERDVLAYEPDIVFLEFAVNDGKNDISRMSFEGLVARILTSKKQPAVVLLFAVSESGYTCHPDPSPSGRSERRDESEIMTQPFTHTPATAAKLAATLTQAAKARILVLDGAMGTMIQRHGLGEADYRGERVRRLARATSRATTTCSSLTQPDVIARHPPRLPRRRRRHHRDQHLQRHRASRRPTTAWRSSPTSSTSPPRALARAGCRRS